MSNLIWEGFERATRGLVPPSWFAALEYAFRPDARDPYGGPLNGQLFRQRIVLDLLQTLPFKAIVETGTCRGSTAEFLGRQSNVPVHTVELSPRFYHFSRLRLRGLPNVRVILGDSRMVLRELAQDPSFPKRGVFFYLDAHSNGDLPLREELELILDHWEEPVVMIDDFEVPWDSGYGFDDYGHGKRLGLDYLASFRAPKTSIYYPAVDSAEETGLKRGCVVLADPALADRLARIRLLRADTDLRPSADRLGKGLRGAVKREDQRD